MASSGFMPSLRSAARAKSIIHDGVLFYDPDEQDDADQGNHAEIVPEDHESDQGAYRGSATGSQYVLIGPKTR